MSLAAPESSCQLFTYTPLPDTDTTGERAPSYIRLIEVHEGEPHDPTIRVSIHVTPVEDAPIYQAVSYTWGDNSIEEQIHVRHASSLARETVGFSAGHDGLMTVRKNCADVLRQVRHFKTSNYYWIDAICIDQQNIPEKNVQVARMGAIFEQSDGVLACIGMHNESSRFVVSMFESFHAHLSRGDTSISVLTEEMSPVWLALDDDHEFPDDGAMNREICLDSCYEWVQGIDAGAFDEFIKSVVEIAKRPYFRRIWTLQELWVTNKIQFFCGLDELPLPTLLFWWEDWTRFRTEMFKSKDFEMSLTDLIGKKLRIHDPDYRPKNKKVARLGFDYGIMLHQRQSGLQEGLASTIQQLTFAQLFNLCRKRQCEDPRDVVYGTLTIGKWTSTGVKMPDGSYYTNEDEPVLISPDYDLSAFELAKLLMPALRENYAMVEVCEMLHIGQETEEIQQAIALRSVPWPQVPVSASIDKKHWSKYSRSLARIRLPGVQLGPDARYRLVGTSEDSKPFTSIIDKTGQGDESECVGIACKRARNGDWLVLNSWRWKEGFILRECGGFLFFIGKATCHGVYVYPGKPQEVSIWLDAEDAVVLMSGPKQPLWLFEEDDDGFRDNTEEVSAYVNNRVCREWGSSFAMLDESDTDEEDREFGRAWEGSDSEGSDSEDHESEDQESEDQESEDYELKYSDSDNYDLEQPSSPLISD